VTCRERKDGTQCGAFWKSQVAGGVKRRCVAVTGTLGTACEVGLNEVEDRDGDSETGVNSR
jgi:hypothetical protein